MEPTTSTSDQNRWWRAACSDTASRLVNHLDGTSVLPLKQIRDGVCGNAPRAASQPPPARDTVDGVLREGRAALPAAPHSVLAETGEKVTTRTEVLHLLEQVLEAVGVGSRALVTASLAAGPLLLVKFIGEIAKANAEGKHAAGCAATARGFATVMAEVLDRGSLRSSTVASLRDRARTLEPKLGARMWLGAQAAAQALHGLTPAERSRIRAELLDRTPHLQVSGSPERQLYYKTQGLLLGWKPARI
ncbi:MAG: hypothetical protein HY906_09260 [Deltaproteobacteria bacterium]|nr:hypothetical protein [Deltaproteobacteria bacterium]